ncbi:SEL1-like repeat protein [Ignatzschineria sp. LJL83]
MRLTIVFMILLFKLSFGACSDILELLNSNNKDLNESELLEKGALIAIGIKYVDAEIPYQYAQYYIKEDNYNPNKIMCAYKMAASVGHDISQKELANIYELGLYGVSKDILRAMYWYEKSARQNNDESLLKLVSLYQMPEIKKMAEEQALKSKDPLDQYLVGIIYSINENYPEAIKWYELSALQGFSEAQGLLAEFYELGLGVPINLDKAIYWYKLGAEQNDVHSLINLGFIYLLDRNLEQHKKALDLFEVARNMPGGNDAIYGLGLIYEEGLAVPKDMTKARSLYLEAARVNVIDAQIHLAEIYKEENRLKESLFWLRKSCENGYQESCDLLSNY